MSDVGVPPALAVRSGLESLEVNLLAMQELFLVMFYSYRYFKAIEIRDNTSE